jgi:2,4-dichlorophenol 6-monooxygenase
LGLNTGVQDVHNLAWKLAAVRRGVSESFLETYEQERKPVAQRNLDHSVRNYLHMNELNKVVGLDIRMLDKLKRLQYSRLFRALPERWQLKFITDIHRFGLKRLSVLSADSRRGERMRAAFQAKVPGQVEHYRFVGMDLGFHYDQGAIVPEASPKPEAANPVLDYRPTTWPGARLPHLWVSRDGQRVAVHDLLRQDGFVLLSQPAGHRSWHAAASAIQNGVAMTVECLSLGPGNDADALDEERLWPRLCEVEPTGAVLVRPDGHVACRWGRLPADPTDALGAVMRRLFA